MFYVSPDVDQEFDLSSFVVFFESNKILLSFFLNNLSESCLHKLSGRECTKYFTVPTRYE